MDDAILVGFSFTISGIYLLLFWRNPHMALHSVQSAWLMFAKALPWMSVSLLMAGLMEGALQKSVIVRLFGADSGVKGVLLAAALGALGTGSRWGVYPLAAAMLSAQASLASVMTFTTSWMLISIPRSASEFPFFGVRLTFLRMLLSFGAALIVGFVLLAWKNRL
ncbi:MAG: permease [Firmicutes bacterium]|nr:permease [Bacillota bacterium]